MRVCPILCFPSATCITLACQIFGWVCPYPVKVISFFCLNHLVVWLFTCRKSNAQSMLMTSVCQHHEEVDSPSSWGQLVPQKRIGDELTMLAFCNIIRWKGCHIGITINSWLESMSEQLWWDPIEWYQWMCCGMAAVGLVLVYSWWNHPLCSLYWWRLIGQLYMGGWWCVGSSW